MATVCTCLVLCGHNSAQLDDLLRVIDGHFQGCVIELLSVVYP